VRDLELVVQRETLARKEIVNAGGLLSVPPESRVFEQVAFELNYLYSLKTLSCK
jgi:hypothetical protein